MKCKKGICQMIFYKGKIYIMDNKNNHFKDVFLSMINKTQRIFISNGLENTSNMANPRAKNGREEGSVSLELSKTLDQNTQYKGSPITGRLY